jgi:hypothetical protein
MQKLISGALREAELFHYLDFRGGRLVRARGVGRESGNSKGARDRFHRGRG